METNRRLILRVSEPWDFVTDCGGGPFSALAVATFPDSFYPGEPRLLCRLDTPLLVGARAVQYLLVSARHVGRSLDDLAFGKVVPCNCLGLTEAETAEARFSVPPCGPGLVGAIELDRGAVQG